MPPAAKTLFEKRVLDSQKLLYFFMLNDLLEQGFIPGRGVFVGQKNTV